MFNPIHYSAFFSCLKGNDGVVPVDPTVDKNNYIPHFRSLYRVQTSSSDYNEKRNITLTINQVRGLVCHMAYATDMFQPVYAKTPSDRIAYCDKPVLHMFKYVEFKVGSTNVDTILPTMLDYMIYNLYTDNYQFIVDEWLGGSKEFNSKNQVYEGYSGHVPFNTQDTAKNIIKPGFRFYLPLMASVFNNADKLKFSLLLAAPMEFNFISNSIRNITTRSCNDFIPEEIGGNLDLWVQVSSPNEWGIFWNKLPYSLKPAADSSPYYMLDTHNPLNEKKYTVNQDYKLSILKQPIGELNLWIYDNTYSSNQRYFGNSLAEAAENFIACHFTPKSDAQSATLLFNIATGKFLSTNTNTSKSWSIENYDPTTNHFELRWQKSNTNYNSIFINTTARIDTFGDLFMDLGLFDNIMNQSLLPKIYNFQSFRLDIRPYNNEDTSFSNSTDSSQLFTNGIRLVNGYFAFNKVNNQFVHAFWGIKDIERYVGCDEFYYDITLSTPISTQTNMSSIYAQRKQVLINRPNYAFYDLDAKHPIKVDSITWERTTGSASEVYEPAKMMLMRDNHKKFNKWVAPQFQICFDQKDSKGNPSMGFQDSQEDNFSGMVVKLTQRELIFDGSMVSELLKEKQNLSQQFNFMLFHSIRRPLKYTNGLLTDVSPQEMAFLTENIVNDILIPQEFMKDITGISKRQKTDNVSAKNSYFTDSITQQHMLHNPAGAFSNNYNQPFFGV